MCFLFLGFAVDLDGEDEFLNGVLQIQVHSAKGILSSRQGRPGTQRDSIAMEFFFKEFLFSVCLDLFCTVEVDSYGRFDRKAKTRVVKDSLAPSWDQVSVRLRRRHLSILSLLGF